MSTAVLRVDRHRRRRAARAGDLERAGRRGGDSRASSCSSGVSRGVTPWRGGRRWSLAASPLFWFTAPRPLSDMLGFAAAMWTLALMAGQPSRAAADRRRAAGGLRDRHPLAGRPSLTLPMLASRSSMQPRRAPALALRWAPSPPACWRGRSRSSWRAAAFRPTSHALTFQAGADFSAAFVMLWTHHTRARRRRTRC